MPKTNRYRQIIKRIVDEAFTNSELWALASSQHPETPVSELVLHILEDIHGECETRANRVKRTITRKQRTTAIENMSDGFSGTGMYEDLRRDAAQRCMLFMPSQTILEESFQTEEDE